MAEKRSAWVYVGIGCAVLLVLGVAVAGLGGFWVFRKAKQLEAELKDPDTRTAKVKQVLGAETLPEGYHAFAAFTVPFVMETAILTDREPNADGMITGFGERGLIYLEMIRMGQDQDELRAFFEGRTSDPTVLRRNNINIDVDEIIGRGVIPTDESTLMYVTQRGSVSAHGVSSDGITSLMLVECPQDKRARVAIWFGPDASPDSGPATAAELTGTPADEAAMREFMGHFRVCG